MTLGNGHPLGTILQNTPDSGAGTVGKGQSGKSGPAGLPCFQDTGGLFPALRGLLPLPLLKITQS